MFNYFAKLSAEKIVVPFTFGLANALGVIEEVSPGYASEMIERMASVKGIGNEPYESLLQILGEIYVTSGAALAVDLGENGEKLFTHEPRSTKNSKNPEFESRSNSVWYAVEVKTPKLNDFSKIRTEKEWQAIARMPQETIDEFSPTLPRDNPIKDFLISANEKFAAYSNYRSDSYRILTIVWDDFVQEAITALVSPGSGLLTENSFYKKDDIAVKFPFVDAILVCRYYHQIKLSTMEKDLIHDEREFVYHNEGFPPKALIQNPHGRVIPDALLGPLNATPYDKLVWFAEYAPQEMIIWMNSRGGEGDKNADESSK